MQVSIATVVEGKISNIDSVVELPWEDARMEAEKLEHRQMFDLSTANVFAGVHPDYGPVRIVLPMIGSGILILPFEPRI